MSLTMTSFAITVMVASSSCSQYPDFEEWGQIAGYPVGNGSDDGTAPDFDSSITECDGQKADAT